MNFEKAKEILDQVAADRIRWGKHGGFNMYSDNDVLDALVYIHSEGFLQIDGDEALDMKSQLTASNRAKGAAEARERKYKGQLDHANEQIRALVIALEEAEKGA